MVGRAEPVSAPRRPDPEPRRDSEGLRNAGTRSAHAGDGGTRQGQSIKVDASTITDPAKFKQFQDAQNALTGALGRLLVTVERYPDLKSNQNFLALQSQLEGTENRIAVARRDYIEGVRQYNTELKTFPGLLWASTLYRSYKPMETFTVAEDLQKPPTVKF
jgi:LemA protein